MVLENITMANFSFAEAQTVTMPLLIFVAGIVIYALFVFKFYRFLSRKNIFELNLQQYNKAALGWLKKFFSLIFYVIEYLIIFPLFTFFWFGIITILLVFLAKSQNAGNLLLIAMALVAAVRVTAYFTEDLSRDLAKMLPFALLGIFLVDVSFFSLENSLATLKVLPSMWKVMIYYLGFTIALEFVLRIVHTLVKPFLPKEE
jgi:hypothetical protein